MLAKDKKEKPSALFESFLKDSIQNAMIKLFQSENDSNFLNFICANLIHLLNLIKHFDMWVLLDQIVIKIALNNSPPSVKELLEGELHGLSISRHFMVWAVNKHKLDKELSYKPGLLLPIKAYIIRDVALLQKIEASPKEVVEGVLYECFSSYKGLFDSKARMQSPSEIIRELHGKLDALSAPPCDKTESEKDRRASVGLG